MGLAVMKFITWLLSPLTIGLAGLVAGSYVLARGWKKCGLGILGGAFLWLWVWSSPWFFILLGGSLERRYPSEPVEKLPRADAIVVLGGGLVSPTAYTRYPELSSAADRGWQAARCYRAGKAPLILFSGVAEGPGMKQFLIDFGVPPDRIVLESASKNTYENGLFTQKKLAAIKARRIILVTSAWHMRRAMLVFARKGFDVVPSGADYEALSMQGVLTPRMGAYYLPTADCLLKNSAVQKEYIGYYAYRCYLMFRRPAG